MDIKKKKGSEIFSLSFWFVVATNTLLLSNTSLFLSLSIKRLKLFLSNKKGDLGSTRNRPYFFFLFFLLVDVGLSLSLLSLSLFNNNFINININININITITDNKKTTSNCPCWSTQNGKYILPIQSCK